MKILMFGNRYEMTWMAEEQWFFSTNMFKNNSRYGCIEKNVLFETSNNWYLFSLNYNLELDDKERKR